MIVWDDSYLHIYAESNIGKVRKKNEDNFLVYNHFNKNSELYKSVEYKSKEEDKRWKYFGVFDGMGGGEKGEVASLIAAQIIEEKCSNIEDEIKLEDIDRIIKECFLLANNNIIKYNSNILCGTTGTILVTEGTIFKIYHIGDSRAYLLRDNILTQLTNDQTIAQFKTRAGIYKREEEAPEYEKHQLTEYIGGDNTLCNLSPKESQWMDFFVEDKILLCTDGLYDLCTNETIKQILINNNSPEKITNCLVQCALENGGKDNITCICISKI